MDREVKDGNFGKGTLEWKEQILQIYVVRIFQVDESMQRWEDRRLFSVFKGSKEANRTEAGKLEGQWLVIQHTVNQETRSYLLIGSYYSSSWHGESLLRPPAARSVIDWQVQQLSGRIHPHMFAKPHCL